MPTESQEARSAAIKRFQRRIFWIRNGWRWGWTGCTWRVLELGKVRIWL